MRNVFNFYTYLHKTRSLATVQAKQRHKLFDKHHLISFISSLFIFLTRIVYKSKRLPWLITFEHKIVSSFMHSFILEFLFII